MIGVGRLLRGSRLVQIAAVSLVLLLTLSCGPLDTSAPRLRRTEHPDLDGERIDELFAAIEAGRYGDVLSLIILIDGAPIVESYFNGHEWDQRAPLYSVTKSVLSALIGIAIAEGHIASVDERVLDYFPEYDPVANLDERKRAMTVGHLLAMTAGLHWDELSLPYDDPNNHYQRYLKSDDRIEYALGLPMDHRPGVQVTYNTALSQILSAILSRATGHSAADYAKEKLFDPLGIDDWRWTAYDRTTSVGGAGLYLLPIDMIKIGQL